MKRRWFLVLGSLVILANVSVLAAFGVPDVSGSTLATPVVSALGGVLFALGGLDRQFQRIEWYQFVGGANISQGIAMGLAFLRPILTGATLSERGIELILAICALVGGASLVFIGVDWIRGGHYFDPASYETGPIFPL